MTRYQLHHVGMQFTNHELDILILRKTNIGTPNVSLNITHLITASLTCALVIFSISLILRVT